MTLRVGIEQKVFSDQ